MNIQDLTRKEQLVWAAGVLEGEGCFTMKTNNAGRDKPAVSCKMTDLDVLENLKEVFGVGHIYEVATENHWKDAWTWDVQARADAIAVMEDVLPFMHGRRRAKILSILRKYKNDLHPRELEPVGHKWCPACEDYRPFDNFSPNQNHRHGLAGYCKPCRRQKYSSR